jgi:hypothetical protein
MQFQKMKKGRIMILSPSRVFKSVSSFDHAEKFSKGEIILRSIEFFRSNACQDLKDFNEFSASKKGHSISLDNQALIFCSHKFKPKCKTHLIEIRSPCVLFTEVKKRLSTATSGAYFGEVIYLDPESTEYDPINFYCERVYLTDKKKLDSGPGIEIAFYKKSKFAHENEVRMCFLVCPEKLNSLNGSGIEVNFYERYIDCTLIQWKDREVEYDYWKSKKTGPADNYDRYWFEACFKLPQVVYKNFHNISRQL